MTKKEKTEEAEKIVHKLRMDCGLIKPPSEEEAVPYIAPNPNPIPHDTDKIIKDFQSSLMEFTIALTDDIRLVALGEEEIYGMKILKAEDKVFDRVMKVIDKQEALIKVLKYSPDGKVEETVKRARISLETVAK